MNKAKLKHAILPSIILLLFIAFMTTGGIIKKPFSEKDNVIGFVNIIRDNVDAVNWTDAMNNMKKLEKAWDIVLARIQFSAEQERIYELDAAITCLEGAIEAKDRQSAIIDIVSIKRFWDNLEN